jgi:ABC-2 type transport system ATP-binding protein
VDVELRQTLWAFIARLNKQGHTVLLTTHYLEEAEALCGRVAMLKWGRVVALERTSELLKAASSNVLRFKLDGALPREFEGKARITGRIVQVPAQDAREIERYLALIREAGLRAEDVEIRKADLEDVFLDVMSKHGEKARAPAATPGREIGPASGPAPTVESVEARS